MVYITNINNPKMKLVQNFVM